MSRQSGSFPNWRKFVICGPDGASATTFIHILAQLCGFHVGCDADGTLNHIRPKIECVVRFVRYLYLKIERNGEKVRVSLAVSFTNDPSLSFDRTALPPIRCGVLSGERR